MTIARLVLRELLHRWPGSLMMLAAALICVACMVASLVVLRGHDLETAAIIEQHEKMTAERADVLREDYRKIMLAVGFNVMILPEGVDPSEAFVSGLSSKDMPESYADKLAGAKVISINHLLPSLSAPVLWPERKMQVVLTGIRGEVTIEGRRRSAPLIDPVKPGQAALGAALARQAGIKPGDRVTFFGHELEVARVEPVRGTRDDMTFWVDLPLAQQLLDKPGRITALQAINCLAANCYPDATGMPKVGEEIKSVLEDTQVVVDIGAAKARIEARERAAAEAKAALEQAKRQRGEIRERLDALAAVLNPVVILACGAWIGFLSMGNVRERRGEIGVLRALGVSQRRLAGAFLGKALIIGIVGAVFGCVIGSIAGALFTGAWSASLFPPRTLLLAAIGAPVLTLAASWLPALSAMRQDPARVLANPN